VTGVSPDFPWAVAQAPRYAYPRYAGQLAGTDGTRAELMSNVSHQFLNLTPAEGAAASLRGSEARFRFLADAAPLLVWMTGPDGRLTYVNRRWLEFTGHTIETQLGGGLYTGVHQDDKAFCLSRFEEAFQDRAHFSHEMRLRRID
jgi:PAS domain-containing protein